MRKFYIIGHNPDKLSGNDHNSAIWCLQNHANALEPDIAYDNSNFYIFDSDQTSRGSSPTLAAYCSGLADFLIQNQNNPDINLALIAWDLKSSGDSRFDFWKIRDIIQTNFIDKLNGVSYGEIPMLFTVPGADWTGTTLHNEIGYLTNYAAPHMRYGWALGTDDNGDATAMSTALGGHGCYTYGIGFHIPRSWIGFLSDLKNAVYLRDAGNRFSLVYGWTINDEWTIDGYDNFKDILDLNVDGIITDVPAKLFNAINGDSRYVLARKEDNPFTCGTKPPTPTPRPFKVKTYKFEIPGQMFVAVNHDNGHSTLLKIKDEGGTGDNMFEIYESIIQDAYSNNRGPNNWLMADQVFKEWIVDIIYEDNNTIIGFSDGRILKGFNTGGGGHNMFNVTESPEGFDNTTTDSRYIYRIGSAKFNNGITFLKYFPKDTVRGNGAYMFIGFMDGKLLKVNGTGGGGYNMFAIQNEFDRYFDPVPNTQQNPVTQYWVGDARFQDYVKGMEFIKEENCTLIWFNNTKLLKIAGLGGSNKNFIMAIESPNGFSAIDTTSSLLGYNVFLGKITCLKYYHPYILIGFDNGKILKTMYAGRNPDNMHNIPDNMLNITEDPYHFGTLQWWRYWVGDQFFPGYKIVDMQFVNGNLIIAMTFIASSSSPIGLILKISGLGYSDNNMFQLKYNGYNLYTTPDLLYAYLNNPQHLNISPLNNSHYFQGDQSFLVGITGMTLNIMHNYGPIRIMGGGHVVGGGGIYVDYYSFISLANGLLIKVKKEGLNQHNMYKLEMPSTTQVQSLPHFGWYVGDELF